MPASPNSPVRSIVGFMIVLLLLFFIFSWFKPSVQTADIDNAAAKRSMDALKKHQQDSRNGGAKPRQ